jgi:type I restriction enzyme M protein
MFEQVFKSLDDIMFQEPGCNSELDYAEQSSWMLFLKYLDDMENERALEAQMTGKAYQPVFEGQYRWSEWAAPKTAEGKPDLDRTRIGSDALIHSFTFPRQSFHPLLISYFSRFSLARMPLIKFYTLDFMLLV